MKYKTKQDKAVQFHENFCSIIVVGADKSAVLDCLNFVAISKDRRTTDLKIRLTCVLGHRKPANLYLHAMTDEQVRGACHILETIHRLISDMGAYGPWPLKLYFPVDKCKYKTKVATCLGI